MGTHQQSTVRRDRAAAHDGRTRGAASRESADDAVAGLLTVIGPLRRVLRRVVRSRSPVPPLPPAQVELLRVVEENPGIGVQDAAAAMHLAANSVSTLVNQLVMTGLLGRNRDENDRRNARLELTPGARARFETWRDRRFEVLRAAMSGLTTAERGRIEAALPALRKVVQNLENMS